MKIVLINPDYMLYSDPPLGLAYLAAYIKKETDFDIRILDQLNYKEIEDKIKEIRPDVIAFTAVSSNFYKVKSLAEEFSRIFPDSTLVIGGVHITISPKSFEDSPFHIAVRGEGEIPFTKLLKELNKNKKFNYPNLKKIKGLLFTDKNKVVNTGLSEQIKDLNELPISSRDLLDMNYYTLPTILSHGDLDPFGSIITSRGCPYNCKFCSSSSFWERRIRFFSAERVANEIEILYKKYKYRKICIYDDIFAINKDRIRKIIKILEEKKILGKIRFHAYGRANLFDEEIARLLKKLNIVSITFGIETGSQKVLSYLKGGIVTIEDNKRALEIARKYGFSPGGFFMVGSPYETLDDMKKTYEFIKKNCRNHFIVYQSIPFPGTEIWDYAIKNKIVNFDYYDKKTKDFVDIDTDILLTKEISKENFKEMFYKIKYLYVAENKSLLLRKFLLLRPRHIIVFFNKRFIKKAFNLRKQFIKRVFKI